MSLSILESDYNNPTLTDIHQALSAGNLVSADNNLRRFFLHPKTRDILFKKYNKAAGLFRYVSSIHFTNDSDITAYCNLSTREIFIGSSFFQKYVVTISDLMFLLLHERNHWLLRCLNFTSPVAMTADDWNISEDTYINGALWAVYKPTLIKRFYQPQDVQCLLYPDNKFIAKWLDDIGFDIRINLKSKHQNVSAKQKLIVLHKMLYKGEDVSYSMWMELCAALFKFLKDTNIQYTSPQMIGGTGHAQQNKKSENSNFKPSSDGYLHFGNDITNEQASSNEDNEVTKFKKYQANSYSLKCGPLMEIPLQNLDLDGVSGELLINYSDDTIKLLGSNEALTNIKNNISTLEDFVSALKSNHSLQNAGEITTTLYPNEISCREVVLLGAGYVPPTWSFHIEPNQLPKIPIYVDVSGSMTVWYPYIKWLCNKLKEYISMIYHFSGRLFEYKSTPNTAKTTGGTDFTLVASHIQSMDYKNVIIFTDDYGSITDNDLKNNIKQNVQIFLIRALVGSTYPNKSNFADITGNITDISI